MRIAFIGLGNMGLHMARNLITAGHDVTGVDLAPEAVAALRDAGATSAHSAAAAASDAEIVMTMLPAGKHVTSALTGDGGAKGAAQAGTLFIDCSTIDVTTARALGQDLVGSGYSFIDAPVSGGVGGAEAGTLTFMVGGSSPDVGRATPVLEAMGKAVIHTGDIGSGQAAKACNNMLLAISMIGTCEAFHLADKLGLDRQKLFDVASKSSGQCWSLTSYCPVPGPVPASPANRDYEPGFAIALMLKDLGLAVEAAKESGAALNLGVAAEALYSSLDAQGWGGKDFSAVMEFLAKGAAD